MQPSENRHFGKRKGVVRYSDADRARTRRSRKPTEGLNNFHRWVNAKGPIGRLLYYAKRGAALRGLEFSITETDFVAVPTHCPVLGIKLNYESVRAPIRHPDRLNQATVDRRDSSKGYVPGNVSIISHRANVLKGDGTAAELRAIATWMEN